MRVQIKAEGVIGLAGCCIAVEVIFNLEQEIKSQCWSGDIQISAKETLTYYDTTKLYTQALYIQQGQVQFNPIHLSQVEFPEGPTHAALEQCLLQHLDRTNGFGYRIYQAKCQGPDIEACLNIDLSRSFFFFEL